MKNLMQVRQLIEEFAEQFRDIIEVKRDENESRAVWFFENNYNGDQFIIIYDHSDSLHHRDGMHINLPVDINFLNDTLRMAKKMGTSMIYIHDQPSFLAR